MYKIVFKPSFIKQAKKLEKNLYVRLREKINLLKDKDNHNYLKVHKLHGKLTDRYSFSLDYGMRIVFRYESGNKIVLLDLGSHDIYK